MKRLTIDRFYIFTLGALFMAAVSLIVDVQAATKRTTVSLSPQGGPVALKYHDTHGVIRTTTAHWTAVNIAKDGKQVTIDFESDDQLFRSPFDGCVK